MQSLIFMTLHLFTLHTATAFYYGQGYVKDSNPGMILERVSALDPRNIDQSGVCTALNHHLSGQVFFPGSSNYTLETTAYWSQSEWLAPYCVFTPLRATDLSIAIKLLVAFNSTFAVRSGGHCPIVGTGNTDHGVLIATTHFTEKTFVPLPNPFGVEYMRAGAANRWGQIYDFLNPYGKIVVGGRSYTIGTSAILGAALSHFSGLYGWGSDNVINFELVTADGSILQVNDKTYPDLAWALKGGSTNYGIVTRYDMATFNVPPRIWGGGAIWAGHNSSIAFLNGLKSWIAPGGGIENANAAIEPYFGKVFPSGVETSGIVMVYNEANATNPELFENFTAIPRVFDGVGSLNYSQIVDETELEGARNLRWNWYSTCISFSDKLPDIVYRNLMETAEKMISNINCTIGLSTEPVTRNHVAASKARGGGAIDLDPAKGGFIIALPYVSWYDPQYDDIMESFLKTVIANIETETKANGIYYPWIWLNDAGLTQDPFPLYGYGSSLPKMKAISRKYDPDRIFQKLVPGFKLGGELPGN